VRADTILCQENHGSSCGKNKSGPASSTTGMSILFLHLPWTSVSHKQRNLHCVSIQ
jgi:hypothetical protein